MPKHLFLLHLWVYTADFGFFCRETISFFGYSPEVAVTKMRVLAPAPYKKPYHQCEMRNAKSPDAGIILPRWTFFCSFPGFYETFCAMKLESIKTGDALNKYANCDEMQTDCSKIFCNTLPQWEITRDCDATLKFTLLSHQLSVLRTFVDNATNLNMK